LQPLAYTTSKISWKLLTSAISRAQDSSGDIEPIDLNLEALSSIVLSCVALEAFVNEISSLANAFLFSFDQENDTRYLETDKQESIIGVGRRKCEEVAKIKDSKGPSFHERYKLLLKELDITQPAFLERVYYLKEIRNGLVHFRLVDIPVVDDEKGIIRYAQTPPEVFKYLENFSIKGWPIIATEGDDGSVEWTLRICTSAMAAWCIDLILDAIIYVLDAIPNGSLKDFIIKAYAGTDQSFVHIFQKGKSDVDLWTNGLYIK